MSFTFRRAVLASCFVATSIGMALMYQNCSGVFQVSSPASERTWASKLDGNGEGYGGKPSGVYASVDTTNACGTATATTLPIRSAIEFKNDQIFSIIENCVPVKEAATIELGNVELISRDRAVVIVSNKILQKADWVQTGRAPKDQYIDLFCSGTVAQSSLPGQPSSGRNTRRQVEVAIYNHRDFLTTENDPQLIASSLSQSLLYMRFGLLRFFDIDVVSNDIVASGERAYERVREHVMIDAEANTSNHLFMSEPNGSNMNFAFGYESSFPESTSTFRPLDMLYQDAPPARPIPISPVTCWRTR